MIGEARTPLPICYARIGEFNLKKAKKIHYINVFLKLMCL